jgi:hypothetical protein
MCPSARGLVVGSYVPFWKGVCGRQLRALMVECWYGFGGRQLCAFQLGVWLKAVKCPSGRWFVVGSYVPF